MYISGCGGPYLFSFTNYSCKAVMPLIICTFVNTRDDKWISKKFNISKPLEKPILCIWGTNICALNYLHNSYTLLVRLFLNLLRANTLNLISVFEQSPIFTDLLQLDLRTFGWKFQMIHLFFFSFSVCHLLRLAFQNETFYC